ncbi:PREDICTED: malignant fibrous histiocytoma-amplified sequence 1 homolog [Branchiostoma belcheri]|uniref:non-specific serine/threonine protein kinase n=1 Tax=Branchiostoma belcheri TaxID=7741 RepID=A0A6P5AAF6_BRABE|nr:PREDICTED: malignant fibrous histiocytoma-amplified sequence 1 homolog [Branchiostoma belcheri]
MTELKLSQCGCCHLAFLNELNFTETKIILQLDFWQLLSIDQHTLMQWPGLLKISMNSVNSTVIVDLEGLKQGQLSFQDLNINSFSTPPQSFIHGLGRSFVDHGYNIQVPPSVHLGASSSQAQVSSYFLDVVSYLDLSHNKLREIPDALSLLGNLTHLDISNNIITALPRSLLALEKIESFYVNRNNIIREGFVDLASFRNLKYVKFDLTNYPPLGSLPASLIFVTITLCDSQSHHVADIDWDIQISQQPHKYFDFVVRSLQGRTPGEVALSDSDMHAISPIILDLPWTQRPWKGNVISLLLSGNNLSVIPHDTSKLLHLQHLDLSRNKISFIPANIWKLSNLKCLDISFNRVQEISDEILFAKRLTTLFVQGNKLVELPQSISNLKMLEELCVFANDVDVSRTPNLFSMMDCKHLKVDIVNAVRCQKPPRYNESLLVHCYYQDVDVIVVSAKILFEHMVEISNISVSLQTNDKQQQLSLNLAGFGLTAYPSSVVSQLNVKAIDLSQNKIRAVPEQVCKLQKELNYLNLSDNSLKGLPLSIGHLQQLEQLILEYNQINQLPESIGVLQNLSVLKLTANCLREVPRSLSDMLGLKEIDLSNNSLESIPEMIGTLKNLTSLDISGNSLSILPSSICSCHSLETMKLSSNMLSQLPDTIDQLESLSLLQASMNILTVIPPSICSLKHLKTLDVSWNSITELPRNLGHLSSLTVLKVENNHLRELPESFTGLVNLTSLNVSSNSLKALPDEIFEFVKLTELHIADNQIDTLPNTICELQKLEYLSLENNKLTVLPNQFGQLEKLHHFGKAQIQGNPIEQPPIEVFEQGLEGVVAYFEELKLSKAIEVPRVKALLLGEVEAGKTSLCNAIRLGKSNLTDITDRTAGIEVHPARLQDSIQVLMHDFGGHRIYHLTHQFFFSTAALYLIVVDLKAFKESSFNAAVKYWLNVIKARIDSKPVLRIVATHIDLCESEEIKEKSEEIMKKMKQIEKIEVESLTKHLSDIDDALNRAGTPCSDWSHSLEGFDTQSLRKRRKFIEHLIDNRPIFPEFLDLVSCDLSLAGIKQLIENIVISCQDHRLFPRRILPKSWFELELAIKTLKQEGNLHYLSMDDVQKVAKEKANMTPTRLTRALKYLHDIGEIVHFSDSPKLSDFVFHKPQWLMDVFKLIYKPVERFDERFASVSDADFDDMVEDFSSRGIVSEQMIQCLWKQMNLSKPEESMLISKC